jgi:Ankyrin repeats (3 copies)/Prenyltransferase and squalene oxidase repeat
MRKIAVLAVLAGRLWGESDAGIRAAVDRALPVLENSAATFVAKRACVSCHHNILPILTMHLARERGVAIDAKALTAVEEKTFRSLRGPAALDDAVQATALADPTPNDSYLLMAAHAAGLAPDLTKAVYARRLIGWQRDGHWVTSDFRPPHSSSSFTATATAARAISIYAPMELRMERDACLLRARRWLASTRPASVEDGSFRLLGLVWAGGAADDIAAARRDLIRMREESGGWAELPGYPADAYSTGEALYALREAGMATVDRDWSTGVQFLLSTQSADGTWRVGTRMISPAQVSPDYFSSGFPYAKDEYLSYAGSSWAVIALLSSLPVVETPAIREENSDAPAWARIALFGSASQLTTLLDGGLNADAKLLAMVAQDAEKVRLALAHGAAVTARPVTIAASYRGTGAAIRILLGALPTDANLSKALERASMTGDLANVKLLLAKGADPSAGLSQAVTFGYPEVVRALIGAGASVKATESSGINLLHWAAITNRPEVVPLLASAGTPINAMDQFGYTPLMYAATIDFGDAKLLKALLKAGADPRIRNDQGRTALEQARFYRHSLLETALRQGF